jgi:hypothetical protein
VQRENEHLAELIGMSTFRLQSHYIWQLCAGSLAMRGMPVSIDISKTPHFILR